MSNLSFNRYLLQDTVNLKTVIASKHQLVKIDLEGCVNFSDPGLKIIGESLGPNLIQIIISFCDQISSECVEQFLRNSKNLRRFDCDSCYKIDDKVFMFLPDSIKWLGLLDCNRISNVGIENFRKRVPDCKIHAYYSDKNRDPVESESEERNFNFDTSVRVRLVALGDRLRNASVRRRRRRAGENGSCCMLQ